MPTSWRSPASGHEAGELPSRTGRCPRRGRGGWSHDRQIGERRASHQRPGGGRRCRRRRGRGRPGWRRACRGGCSATGTPSTRTGGRSAAAVEGQLGRSASAMAEPTPPSRKPSSTVTTSGWAAASASISGSSGLTTRGSHTVAVDALGREHVGGGLGAAAEHLADAEEADVGAARAPCGPRRPRADLVVGHASGPAVFGQRMATGPLGDVEGVVQHLLQLLVRRRGEDRHARAPSTAAPCRARRGATAPSSPVMPARSRQKTTGWPCRPTSRLTWSMARVRNVE